MKHLFFLFMLTVLQIIGLTGMEQNSNLHSVSQDTLRDILFHVSELPSTHSIEKLISFAHEKKPTSFFHYAEQMEKYMQTQPKSTPYRLVCKHWYTIIESLIVDAVGTYFGLIYNDNIQVKPKYVLSYLAMKNAFAKGFIHRARYKKWQEYVNLPLIHGFIIKSNCIGLRQSGMEPYFLSAFHGNHENTLLTFIHYFVFPKNEITITPEKAFIKTAPDFYTLCIVTPQTQPSLYSNLNHNGDFSFDGFDKAFTLYVDSGSHKDRMNTKCLIFLYEGIKKIREERRMLRKNGLLSNPINISTSNSFCIMSGHSYADPDGRISEVVTLVNGPVSYLTLDFLSIFLRLKERSKAE